MNKILLFYTVNNETHKILIAIANSYENLLWYITNLKTATIMFYLLRVDANTVLLCQFAPVC